MNEIRVGQGFIDIGIKEERARIVGIIEKYQSRLNED